MLIGDMIPQNCHQCRAIGHTIAYLAESWIAGVLKAQTAPRNYKGSDVIDSAIFPGWRFQVKVSMPHAMTHKSQTPQWTWHEHNEADTDLYILGGIDTDIQNIYWFVLPKDVWMQKSHVRKNCQQRSVYAPSDMKGSSRGRPWIFPYYASTAETLLGVVSQFTSASSSRFHLLCWHFCQILGGRRKGSSDPGRDAWPNTQDATKAPNQPAAGVAPCVSDPRTIRPGSAGGARGVGHEVSRTAFYPC